MATTPGTGKDELQHIAHDAMLQRGLLPDFSPAVIAEANQLTQAAVATGGAIRDLRALLWASIDNDDSRDLDQLSVAQPEAGGAVKILVAIADVDALVKKGSAIDGHAATNTTSVYTAAEIFPMLPENLSTKLTSLADGQERLAIVIEMVIGTDGMVSASDIYQAAVLNRAKLAYNSVAAWLEGTASAPPKLAAVPGMDEQIRIQERVAQSLRKVRRGQGALQLETLEVRAVFQDTLGLIHIALVAHYGMLDSEANELEKDLYLWFVRFCMRPGSGNPKESRSFLLVACCQFAREYQKYVIGSGLRDSNRETAKIYCNCDDSRAFALASALKYWVA